LQQSGQSGQSAEEVNKQQQAAKEKEAAKKACEKVLEDILVTKLNPNVDPLMMMGAFEVLSELLKDKFCYEILSSFWGIFTKLFVNGHKSNKKYLYLLLVQLIQSFERFQNVQKRINIDTFEDEEFLNSGSGSFFDGKKSKANSVKKASYDDLM